MPYPFPLAGEKVRLRALETRDLDAIWTAYQDLELELITSGDSPPVSDAQVRAFWQQRIDAPAPEHRYFAIEPLQGQPGVFAGMCNLYDVDMRNRGAELAIWLASTDLRGRGYGTEAVRLLLGYAFEVCRLERVHLGVYDFNEGGMRAYERAGFRYEGRLHNAIWYQGRYWDEWPMRILRAEWELDQSIVTDGLRPYRTSDYEGAAALLITLDAEADPLRLLRYFWRDGYATLWTFQVDQHIVGLVPIHQKPTTRAFQLDYVLPEHRVAAQREAGRLILNFA